MRWFVFSVLFILVGCQSPKKDSSAPTFTLDPLWLKLPEGQVLGRLRGIAVDDNDHVWLVHKVAAIARAREGQILLAAEKGLAECCVGAPPVMEFDSNGNFVQGWGGPGDDFDWPRGIHGIHIDHTGHVWIAGEDPRDAMILKFSKSGEFVLQIGKAQPDHVFALKDELGWVFPAETSNEDKTNVGRAADIRVYPPTNELFVADGYGNHRVVVFDADTGAYQRHWGAYGNTARNDVPDPPNDARGTGPGATQFQVPHDIAISDDGLVYVADRGNNRIQVFNLDGSFVTEQFIAKKTAAMFPSVMSLALSSDEDQQFLYVGDSGNGRIRVLERESLTELGKFGRLGMYPGQFVVLHNIRTDSQGNIYAGDLRQGVVHKFDLDH